MSRKTSGPQGRAARARNEPGQHRRCATAKQWAGGARGARSDPPRPARRRPAAERGTSSSEDHRHAQDVRPDRVASALGRGRWGAHPQGEGAAREPGQPQAERGTSEPGLNTPPATATMTTRGAADVRNQHSRRRGTRSRPRRRRRPTHQHRRRPAATTGRRRTGPAEGVSWGSARGAQRPPSPGGTARSGPRDEGRGPARTADRRRRAA